MKGTPMKKFAVIFVFLLIISGCGSDNAAKPADNKITEISFEAYLKEGENFTFTFTPEDAVSYQELKDAQSSVALDASNWSDIFTVREVYREHYEYDEAGNRTSTYMKGSFYAIELLDKYCYADNWSRNGLEFKVHVKGQETRVITNDGKTYDPVTLVYDEVKPFSGGDPILILSDFENSWDEITNEKYTGTLDSYEIIEASNSYGDLHLLDSSAVNFKKFKDNIFYLAAYDSPEEYFVIFFESEDGRIERENEYYCAVYHKEADRELERYSGYTYEYPWAMIIQMMDVVNNS